MYHISLLQFIISITAIIFFFFWIDLYKRWKATILHFLVFLWWGLIVLFFIWNPALLNKFWSIFWLTRWADLIVYASIISLAYFYIELLNSHIKDKQQLTKLVSALACEKAWEKQKQYILDQINKFKSDSNYKDQFLFHIRCYNESKTIWTVLDKIINYWFRKILILNDWSSDNTLEIVKNKQKENPNIMIIIVSHSINRWPWAINQTWFEFCKRYWDFLDIKRVVMFDADDQMEVNDMENFITNIKKYPDIKAWFGSRFKWVKPKSMPLIRKIILKIWKLVSKILYKNKIEDYHCWYRVFDLNIIKKIKLNSDWFHYANELIENINNLKIPSQEVPVKIKYTDYSLSKWQKSSNAIKMWFEMLYRKFFFR